MKGVIDRLKLWHGYGRGAELIKGGLKVEIVLHEVGCA